MNAGETILRLLIDMFRYNLTRFREQLNVVCTGKVTGMMSIEVRNVEVMSVSSFSAIKLFGGYVEAAARTAVQVARTSDHNANALVEHEI